MEAKISKAQIEVWEWKENLYKELKSIPRSEKLKYIRNKIKITAERFKKEKSV